MEQKDIIERLIKYGIDYDEVIERFSADESFYIECINIYFDEKHVEKLKIAIDKRDYNHAFEIAHNLKGVVGNLGLTNLYIPVCTLLESLRAKEYSNIAHQLNDVIQEQSTLINLLNLNRI